MDKYQNKGFTLIELLIAVAIVGILAGIAFPSYQDYVARSNRAEAQRELMLLANRMEQYFLDHRVYTTDMRLLGVAADPFITETGNYSIDASVDNDAETYTITATAQGGQATSDSSCRRLTINELGQRGGADASNNDSECWEQ